MTTEATERDLITEVEELLASVPEFPTDEASIKHALFADAVERECGSPFWGWTSQTAKAYARFPELLRRLVEEVKTLRKRIKTMERDAREDAQAAANEARWQERQGEDYGSY